MRAGWNIMKAGDIFEMTDFVSNGSFASLRENVEYLDHPDYAVLVRLADYSNGFDSSRFVYVSKKSYEYLAKSKLFGGEIIMSNVGSVGKSFICPDLGCPMTIGPNAVLIRSKNNAFFQYYFQTEEFQRKLLSISSKATLLKFNKTNFKTLDIPVPSLPEQQRIVDILDQEFAKIDALKANAEKSLQAAKDLFQATLKKELEPKEGWRKRRIGDLCEIYNGGTPSTSIEEYWDGGIQWITPKDMGKSKEMYVSQCERTISKEGVEHSSTKVLPERSVIVSSRAPIGYVAINSVPMATNQGCKGFIPGRELYPEFLYYFLLSSTELLNKLGTGATFKEVSGKKLAEITLDFPDIEEQREIAKHILSLSQSCSILQQNYKKTLTLCDDLKQALLRKAFNGEL